MWIITKRDRFASAIDPGINVEDECDHEVTGYINDGIFFSIAAQQINTNLEA